MDKSISKETIQNIINKDNDESKEIVINERAVRYIR
jgi:hypothetical protein